MLKFPSFVGATAALVLLAPAAAQAAPGYYPSGPQVGVDRATVLSGGWRVCYAGNYGDFVSLASRRCHHRCTVATEQHSPPRRPERLSPQRPSS